MYKRVHIYDMDGTIVCSMHRYRTQENNGQTAIDLQYWLDNEHRAMEDSLLPLAQQYKEDLANPETFVIIATARVLNTPDLQFIREILGEPNAIVSREGRKDTRKGAEMKIAGLFRIFNHHDLWIAEKHFWEDNMNYLTQVCKAIGAKAHFVPSRQGW